MTVDAQPIHPGQWRLSRIEVVNWGTFGGHHVMPVSRKGLPITGKSGSGKSTLLDAVATALTPPGRRSYNAAARSGNTKGDDRTLVSYIRGAYAHHTTSADEVASVYLRPRAAMWSGVQLVYDCAQEDGASVHEPVNLIALFHLRAGSVANDDVAKLFAIIRGSHDLIEFAPFIENGTGISGFNRAYKGAGSAFSSFGSYAAKFTRMLGISSPKTLELLHKTQAAKNFGSLDELFRKFMLDDPQTYQLADEAVEQFSSLEVAYTGVKEQRVQMEALLPLEKLEEERGTLQARLADVSRLLESAETFAHVMELERHEDDLCALVRERERLTELQHAAEREFENAQRERERAQTLFEQHDGLAYESADKDVLTSRKHVEEVNRWRIALLKEIACLGVESVPVSLAGFSELKSSARSAAEEAERQRERIGEQDIETGAEIKRLRQVADETQAELRHLREKPTNIPAKYHGIRCKIADATGIDERDLPFVGEMIDVRSEHADWAGALERLIGKAALTLLVPAAAASAVAAFINATYLGVRFEFAAVPAEVEVRSKRPSPASSVCKLKVERHDAHPEFSDHVNALLRTRFDFECVEESDALKDHAFALTREGLIKRKGTYIKDDRCRIDDRSHWLLGTSNEAKTAVLERRLEDASSKLVEAVEAMEKLRDASDTVTSIMHASRHLEEADWKNYDIETARADLEDCENHLNELRSGNAGLAQAADARGRADIRLREAQTALIEAQHACRENDRCVREKNEAVAEAREKTAGDQPLGDADRDELFALFMREDTGFREAVQRIYKASAAVNRQLGAEKEKANEDLALVERKAAQIQHAFKADWPMQAADLGEAPGDIPGYLSILRRIRSTGLPEYETQFLKVLTEFSQDRITALNVAIRGAFREVKQKLEPVNRSLGMSEYAPGVHLQMKVKSCRSAQAEDFLSDLRSILDNEWSDNGIEGAEARYQQLSRIVKRLSSSEYADRKWRSLCLDTREHVTFIAEEVDASGQVRNVHSSDAGLSGGQKQKLVVFCLAAALRYQLSDEDEALPAYATVVLDEAFDKADTDFAKMAMDVFGVFGFHMVLATPMKFLKTLECYMGAYVYVHCEDERCSTMQLVEIEEASDGAASAESAKMGEPSDDDEVAAASDGTGEGDSCAV